jgi:RNA polymerase sigma-70 factor, ECF subfamily
MSFPSQAEELALHERVLQNDPVAPVDVFRAFMEPILRVLCSEMGCSREDAHDSAIDVVISYLNNPERYDRHRARLSTYLTQSAKNRAMDRRRSTAARTRREQEFATVVELQARSPKEILEISVETRLAVERLDDSRLSERDREFLRLILQGERSTRRLAEVLGLPSLPKEDLQREVKRRRDRLMKWLERLGKEDSDVGS